MANFLFFITHSMSGQLVGVMTLNEIQDYLEGRIQIDVTQDPADRDPADRGDRPVGGTGAAVQSTFELDPMHIIHK